MLNCLELFSGAGGLAKGLELAGAKHCAFVEWNKDACNTLRANYPVGLVHETDIRDFSYSVLPQVDIVAGGPPCQPFSIGGKALGYEDRRDMFPYAVSSIRDLMPKSFIFENVKGLLRKSFAEYFNYIILQLTYPQVKLKSGNWKENLSKLERIHTSGKYSGLRYNVVYRVLNAADFGVPQKRERVIIVGIREDLGIEWNFPSPSHSSDALNWDKYVTGEYWTRHRMAMPKSELDTARKEKKRLESRYGLFRPDTKPWITVRDALAGLPQPEHNASSEFEGHVFQAGAKSYNGHTGSEIDMPSKTIKAGDHGVPGGENMVRFEDGSVRYFTTFEAKRIQSFPDDYHITGSWTEAMRQIGNAVPVTLAKTIAESLFPLL